MPSREAIIQKNQYIQQKQNLANLTAFSIDPILSLSFSVHPSHLIRLHSIESEPQLTKRLIHLQRVMCYIGKATKIFFGLVAALLIVGLVAGFGLARRSWVHKTKPACESANCRPIYADPIPADAAGTAPNPIVTPVPSSNSFDSSNSNSTSVPALSSGSPMPTPTPVPIATNPVGTPSPPSSSTSTGAPPPSLTTPTIPGSPPPPATTSTNAAAPPPSAPDLSNTGTPPPPSTPDLSNSGTPPPPTTSDSTTSGTPPPPVPISASNSGAPLPSTIVSPPSPVLVATGPDHA